MLFRSIIVLAARLALIAAPGSVSAETAAGLRAVTKMTVVR